LSQLQEYELEGSEWYIMVPPHHDVPHYNKVYISFPVSVAMPQCNHLIQEEGSKPFYWVENVIRQAHINIQVAQKYSCHNLQLRPKVPPCLTLDKLKRVQQSQIDVREFAASQEQKLDVGKPGCNQELFTNLASASLTALFRCKT